MQSVELEEEERKKDTHSLLFLRFDKELYILLCNAPACVFTPPPPCRRCTKHDEETASCLLVMAGFAAAAGVRPAAPHKKLFTTTAALCLAAALCVALGQGTAATAAACRCARCPDLILAKKRAVFFKRIRFEIKQGPGAGKKLLPRIHHQQTRQKKAITAEVEPRTDDDTKPTHVAFV